MGVGYYERIMAVSRPGDFQAGHELGDQFGRQGPPDLGDDVAVLCWQCHRLVGPSRQELGFAVCFKCDMALLSGRTDGLNSAVVLAEDHEKEANRKAIKALAAVLEKAFFG